MDGIRFDSLVKGFSDGGLHRRNLLKTVIGGALGGAVGWTAIDDGAAKRKKGKKKKCVKNFKICPADATKCCGKKCCTDTDGTTLFCTPKKSACCPAGGSCAKKNPVCCENEGVTVGCAPTGATCCPGGTTYCSADFPTCCPPSTEFPIGSCCSGGPDCCEEEAAGARHARAAAQTARPSGRKR